MMASPTRRADGRGTIRPRTLVCTAEGVWLWPGTPLTQRRGPVLVPIPTPQLYELVAAFHGAGVHAPSLARTVQSAAACLNLDRAREAVQIVAALDLPPVSFEGAALMRAIGRRLGIAVPGVAAAGHPGTPEQELIERLASVHDGKRAVAWALEPVFNLDLFRVAPSTALFDPALHPRWPAGRPDGGQFRRWGRRVADEIHDAIERGDADRLAEIADALSRADWIKDQLDNIVAAQDPPRSLDDLIDAAQDKGPRPGYDDHHIIEQGPQNRDVPEGVVEAKNNIVRIPRYKHWQINQYYQTEQDQLGGLTPGEYLKGKTIDERYQYGLNTLRKFAVLK